MNKLIRYTHRVSFALLIFTLAACHLLHVEPPIPTRHVEWIKDIDTLPIDHAKTFREFHAKAKLLMTDHLVAQSMFLCVVMAALTIEYKINRSTNTIAHCLGGRRRVEGMIVLQALNAC